VPRPDTGNFNRFLTSLGLLMLGASLVIPYFYFRNTEILVIPAAELHDLTPRGRSAILSRQDAIAAFEPWVVGLAAFLALAGLVLLVVGALRLRSAQVMEDEESALRRKRARLEVEEMSPAEQEQTKVEKAKTEVAEEGMVQAPEPSPRAATESEPPAEGAAPVIRPDWRTSWSSRVAVISRISDRVNEALRDLETPPYEFKWQVRIGSAGDELRLDGLFESQMFERPDVVLSNRLMADPTVARKNARNLANDMIATLSRYEALTRRRAQGWIINVLPEESGVEMNADLSQAFDPLRRALAGFGYVTVIREAELDSLPVIFRQNFRGA
jgi:hypothetical protein